ncbi:MAG TPA: YihY/virulence factor BrkB family protein [Burkholderiaceae bacterium]|nr:YihY/virulence factor BrkB family protein [Burkholderiaceae bacterium]
MTDSRNAQSRARSQESRSLWQLARESVAGWLDDYAPSMGAAISYYTTFSIAPLLLIVIAIAGLVFGEEAARGEVFAQLRGLLGDDGAAAVEQMVEKASEPAAGTGAALIGFATLIVGATTVFAELQSALDRIWHAPERVKPTGIWGVLRARVLSFGVVLAIGFLLIVSLVASAAMSALANWWAPYFEEWTYVARLLDFVVPLVLLTIGFALIYKIIPSVRVAWRDVFVGAAATAIMFTIGKFLIGLYVAHAAVASTFGAAGSLVILLVWVYYSAQIFLLGAEFTWAWSHRKGSRSEGESGGDRGAVDSPENRAAD